MKFPGIHLLVLIPFLLVNIAVAAPPQRLIIQFDRSLSDEQKQALDEQIKLTIKTDYELLPHSTNRRWIIVVDPTLNKTELERAIEAMTKLEHVEYAEPDQLMKVFR